MVRPNNARGAETYDELLITRPSIIQSFFRNALYYLPLPTKDTILDIAQLIAQNPDNSLLEELSEIVELGGKETEQWISDKCRKDVDVIYATYVQFLNNTLNDQLWRSGFTTDIEYGPPYSNENWYLRCKCDVRDSRLCIYNSAFCSTATKSN